MASRTEGSTGLGGKNGLNRSFREALQLLLAGRDFSFWKLPLGMPRPAHERVVANNKITARHHALSRHKERSI
jgi:hypothetical protein